MTNQNTKIAFRFAKVAPGFRPIDISDAKTKHINYLNLGPHIKMTDEQGKDQIVHSLHITKEDLDILHQYGQGGIRLYFCKEPLDDDTLNMVVVPVDITGHNVVDVPTDANDTPIFNTLDPCPDQCPPAMGPHVGSYSTKDLNFVRNGQDRIWYKPNMKKSHGDDIYSWFKDDNTPVDPPNLENDPNVDLTRTS